MAVACYKQGCGASVCFTPEVEARLRRTHESWTCPFGHYQHFIAKSDMELRVEAAERRADRWRERWEMTTAHVGTCPWPECKWKTQADSSRILRMMARHWAKVHGVKIEIPNRLRAVA